jgi:hypothetical protein
MKQEDEPHTNDPSQDSLISLTDLIDEMDRASFRRTLANREPAPLLEITDHTVAPRPKSQQP